MDSSTTSRHISNQARGVSEGIELSADSGPGRRGPETGRLLSVLVAPCGKPGRKQRPLPERFWEKVQKGPGCWIWTGAKRTGSRGEPSYGAIRVSGQGKVRTAHAVSWELANESSVPPGLVVRHSCHNPACVRPEHLSLGSHLDNRKDMVVAGRASTPGRVLSVVGLAELKKKILSGEHSVLQLASMFGVARQGLYRMRNRMWGRK